MYALVRLFVIYSNYFFAGRQKKVKLIVLVLKIDLRCYQPATRVVTHTTV